MLRRERLEALRQATRRTLGDVEVHDGWRAPEALLAALGSADSIWLRAAPPLAESAPDATPAPKRPVFLCWAADGSVTAHGDGEPDDVVATELALTEERVPCCDSPKCRVERRISTLSLQCDPPLALAELVDADELAAALHAAGSARLGGDAPAVAAMESKEEPLPARWAARWVLRREGDELVLRDYASHGPRENAALERALWLTMAAAGLVAWGVVYYLYTQSAYAELAVAAAVAVVLSLAAFATSFVARHSARYHEDSEAVLKLSRGQVVLAPWHLRDGSLRAVPEGRYGAALPLDELDYLEVVAEGDSHIIRAHTSHGPYDVGAFEEAAPAEAWRIALTKWARALTHRRAPKAKASLAAMVLLIGAAACGPSEEAAHPAVGEPAPVAPASAQITASDPAVAATGSATGEPMPAPASIPPLTLIDDDVPRAMQLAGAADKVVMVEVWAPWCHTCKSMKAFVLPDPAIRALQDEVVFAAVDSDRPENEPFMERYAVNVWPTLFVLRPDGGDVLGLWQGAASVAELRTFITDALDVRDAELDPSGPASAMLQAKKAQAIGDYGVAARHYQAALKRAPADWPRRSQAMAGHIFSEYRERNWQRCASLGIDYLPAIEGAAVPADTSYTVLACAGELNGELRDRARAAAMARLARQVESPPPAASADDLSDALSIYAGALAEAGDRARAREMTLRQIAILEAAAKAAPGPKEASTFDYARMNAYLSVGRGEDAVALLEGRVRELPDDYEAPARLAQTLLALGRAKEAVAPAQRAVDNSYGPRKLRYLDMLAKAHRKSADAAGERKALEALVAHHATLSKTQLRSGPWTKLRDAAAKRLQAL